MESVDLLFGDGRYNFRFLLPQALELERVCGTRADGDKPAQPKSILAIYDQLSGGIGHLGKDMDKPVYMGGGAALTQDIREVIRLALIGGGKGMVGGVETEVGPLRARELVETYVFPARPVIEGLNVAWAVLHVAVTGAQLKKNSAPVDEAPDHPPSAEATSSPIAASSD